MKNRKGFTLVELLAVIAVLGIIMVIATTNVMKSIRESKDKAKYIAAKEIVDIASAYIATETDGVTVTGNTKCVSITALLGKGYLESDVTNPRTGENGGIDSSQEVCTSTETAQDDYIVHDNKYRFEGYYYKLQ